MLRLGEPSTPRRWPLSGRRSPGRTADESNIWDAGRYGIAYIDSKHEAEVTAMRLVARGLPLVIVNPAHVLGAGRSGPHVDDARAAVHAAADPGIRRRAR